MDPVRQEYRKNMCVVCALSKILDVDKSQLLGAMYEEADSWKLSLSNQGSMLSLMQVQLIRYVHDIYYGCGLDCNLLRYLSLKGLTRNFRLYVLSFRDNHWKVVVIQHPKFKVSDSNSMISIMSIVNNHATIVTKLPQSFGGNLVQKDGSLRSISGEEASTLETWWRNENVEIVRAPQIAVEDVFMQPGTVSRESLRYCDCCNEHIFFESDAAGHVNQGAYVGPFMASPSTIQIPSYLPLNHQGLPLKFLADQSYFSVRLLLLNQLKTCWLVDFHLIL